MSVSVSSSPKTAKGSQRRDAIIAAARTILLRDGYAGFTLRDVASAADMSLGNLQYYYPARDDLVAAVINDEMESSFAIIGEVNWRQGHRDTIIRGLTRTLLTRLAGAAGEIYLIMGFLALNTDRFQSLVDECYEKIMGLVEHSIIQAAPDLDADDLQMTTDVIIAIFDGAISRIHAQPDRATGDTLEAYIDRIADGVIKMLRV